MTPTAIDIDESEDILFDVIDVLCVVDGQSLLNKYPNTGPNNHKVLGGNEIKPFCRMITRQRNVLSDTNARDDLIIDAQEGDTIRWRATSLTCDDEIRVDITDFYSFDQEKYIAKPHQPDKAKNPDLWMTKIAAMDEDKGEETYWLKFKVSQKVGKAGYFDWDPKIVATKR